MSAIINQWGVDGHSHSFFTLLELLSYDYNQITKSRGVVNKETYKMWRRCKKEPHTYCAMIGGPNVEMISNKAMDRMIKQEEKDQEKLGIKDSKKTKVKEYHTQVEWLTTYAEEMRPFFGEVIPKLHRYFASGLTTEDIRFVFFFDN